MLTLIGLLVACGPTAAKITLEGEPTVTVHTTDAVAAHKATVVDEAGAALPTQPALVWTVTPDTVAKLDGDKVVPVADGEATVKACAEAICAEYKFVVAMPNDIAVTGTDGVQWAVGATAQLAAKVLAGEAEVAGQTVTWTSSDANIADVDATGKVTAKAMGAVTITAASGALTEALSLTIGEALPATADAAAAPAAGH
jgi:hypothetical protein